MKAVVVGLLSALCLPGASARAMESLAVSGSSGWGLGLEAPEVGIFGGLSRHDRLGVGRNFGAGAFWRASQSFSLGVHVFSTQTASGQALVNYVDVNGARRATRAPVEWQSLAVAAEAAYAWHRGESPWIPYAGVMAGWMYGGYVYRFTDNMQDLEQIPQLVQTATCSDYVCPVPDRVATGNYPLAGLKGGVILTLTSWLSASLDAVALGTILRAMSISNTRLARHVTSPAEPMIFGGLTFSLKLVL
jgi:hypothetical protein